MKEDRAANGAKMPRKTDKKERKKATGKKEETCICTRSLITLPGP